MFGRIEEDGRVNMKSFAIGIQLSLNTQNRFTNLKTKQLTNQLIRFNRFQLLLAAFYFNLVLCPQGFKQRFIFERTA